MRLFFALWPDDAVRQELARWAAECKRLADGRVIPVENLHATLAFLGEIDPAQIDRLCSLGGQLRAQGFDLVLDEVQYWPHNRVVCATCTEMPAVLDALAETLRAGLSSVGLRIDPRPYVPHVTLLRDARRGPVGLSIAALLWRVNDIVLVESGRQSGRLVYRPIRRFTLAV